MAHPHGAMMMAAGVPRITSANNSNASSLGTTCSPSDGGPVEFRSTPTTDVWAFGYELWVTPWHSTDAAQCGGSFSPQAEQGPYNPGQEHTETISTEAIVGTTSDIAVYFVWVVKKNGATVGISFQTDCQGQDYEDCIA